MVWLVVVGGGGVAVLMALALVTARRIGGMPAACSRPYVMRCDVVPPLLVGDRLLSVRLAYVETQ